VERSPAGGETSAAGGFPDSRQLALPLGFPAVGNFGALPIKPYVIDI